MTGEGCHVTWCTVETWLIMLICAGKIKMKGGFVLNMCCQLEMSGCSVEFSLFVVQMHIYLFTCLYIYSVASVV